MKKLLTLGVVTFSAIILVACSTNSSNNSANETSSSSSEVKTEQSSSSQKTYKVGDNITFDNGVEITIKNAEWTDERNEFDEPQPEKVLKVTYSVMNGTDKDYTVGSDMDLYVDGKKMETHSIGTILDTISAGRSLDNAVQAFGVNGSGKMELEVKQGFNFENNEKKIVELDLQ